MSVFTRREMLGALVAAGAPQAGLALAPGVALAQKAPRPAGTNSKPPRFAFDEVIGRARELAGAPFEDPQARLPRLSTSSTTTVGATSASGRIALCSAKPAARSGWRPFISAFFIGAPSRST